MKTLLAAGLVLATLLGSCQSKKDDTPTPQPPTASFAYTGTAQNFTAIAFTSNAPGAATYAWDFGDATKSTEANPSHVFRRAGTYTVLLSATGTNGTATSRQTLTLAQADTAAIINQRMAGSYRFNRVYRINYNTYTNSPTIYTRLRDTTLNVTSSPYGVDMYGRSWALRYNYGTGSGQRPTYTYIQGVGSLLTYASFLQTGDSVSFSINNIPGNGPGPKEYLTFYGGKIH